MDPSRQHGLWAFLIPPLTPRLSHLNTGEAVRMLSHLNISEAARMLSHLNISEAVRMLPHLNVSEAVRSCLCFGRSSWALWAYTQTVPAYDLSCVYALFLWDSMCLFLS